MLPLSHGGALVGKVRCIAIEVNQSLMTCMDAGWEGPPGEGRSRDEKVLNIESEWKKVSSSFLPEEGFSGRLWTEVSEWRCLG